jgi:hypothetical protein
MLVVLTETSVMATDRNQPTDWTRPQRLGIHISSVTKKCGHLPGSYPVVEQSSTTEAKDVRWSQPTRGRPSYLDQAASSGAWRALTAQSAPPGGNPEVVGFIEWMDDLDRRVFGERLLRGIYRWGIPAFLFSVSTLGLVASSAGDRDRSIVPYIVMMAYAVFIFVSGLRPPGRPERSNDLRRVRPAPRRPRALMAFWRRAKNLPWWVRFVVAVVPVAGVFVLKGQIQALSVLETLGVLLAWIALVGLVVALAAPADDRPRRR